MKCLVHEGGFSPTIGLGGLKFFYEDENSSSFFGGNDDLISPFKLD